MKKISALVLSLLLPLMLGLPRAALAEDGAQAAPLLYQATDDAGHKIYLLGTIHIGREDMYPLSGSVESAYRDAELLAVEVDLVDMMQDAQQMLTYSLALMYPAGDSAQNHLSPETYALGVEKLGYPEITLNRMQAAAWVSLAEEMCDKEAGLSSDFGVDLYLLTRAYEEKKPVEALESMEFQMNLLLDIPDAMADYQLREMLAHPDGAASAAQSLFAAWRQGDEELLSRLLETDMESMPEEIADACVAYAEKMYGERNRKFFEDAKAYLADGRKAMIAVGAAHIVGEGGVADLLRQAGYHVTEIGHGAE